MLFSSIDIFQNKTSETLWTSSKVNGTCHSFEMPITMPSKSKGLVQVDCKEDIPFICQGLQDEPCPSE